MTNKEAIEQLKWVGNRICQITCLPETFDAIDLAIKALEERPQGEWYYNYQNGWHCSICNKAPTVEVPENAVNCVLTEFGNCSYNETGCSDCKIKDKIRKALEFAESQRIGCENCANRNRKSKEVCTSPYGVCRFFLRIKTRKAVRKMKGGMEND